MYGKLLFAAGLGAGYLFGTRRGRKDYEMLKSRVSRLWLDPRVQKAAKQATDVVEKNVPLGEKATEARTAATRAARANVGTTGATTTGTTSGPAAATAS
jgi:hypothetical protein